MRTKAEQINHNSLDVGEAERRKVRSYLCALCVTDKKTNITPQEELTLVALNTQLNTYLKNVEQILFGRITNRYHYSLGVLKTDLMNPTVIIKNTALKTILSNIIDIFLVLAFKDNADIMLEYGLEIAALIGEEKRVIKVLHHLVTSGFIVSLYAYPSLMRLVIKGDTDTINLITKNCLANTTGNYLDVIYKSNPDIKKRIRKLEKDVKQYCAIQKIPYKCKDPGKLPAIINMAGEIIQKKHYRLVIGVTKSGSPLAVVIKLLGGRVSFINPHNHTSDNATWVNSSPIRISHFEPILVCEDDIVSGNALRKAKSLLRGTTPSVALYSSMYTTYSKEQLEAKLPTMGYSDLILPEQFKAANFLDTITSLELVLASKLKKGR